MLPKLSKSKRMAKISPVSARLCMGHSSWGHRRSMLSLPHLPPRSLSTVSASGGPRNYSYQRKTKVRIAQADWTKSIWPDGLHWKVLSERAITTVRLLSHLQKKKPKSPWSEENPDDCRDKPHIVLPFDFLILLHARFCKLCSLNFTILDNFMAEFLFSLEK